MALSLSDLSCEFLAVCPGDLVVVGGDDSMIEESGSDWWLGHVIHSTGSARNAHMNSLFQVVNIDTGFVKTINADLVKGILRPKSS